MFESGMRIVGMPAAERATAASRPEKLGESESVSTAAIPREGDSTHEGAVSAQMTVNLRFRAAFFRNASTVFEWPIVKMNSLRRIRKSASFLSSPCRNAYAPRVNVVESLLAHTAIRRLNLVHELLNRLDEYGLQVVASPREDLFS